jgi:acyl carrier protein
MSSSVTTEQPVLAWVTEIFRLVFNDPDLELTPRSTADEVPGWDSMTHITLIVEAECRYGIMFHPAEIESLHTVGELVRAIEVKRGPRAGSQRSAVNGLGAHT